ncbi:MAG: helix-turn-helix transcriptional regulator [Pseudomonadales bacterium]
MSQDSRILRRTEVEKLTGLSRSTIYKRMSDGVLPRPIKLGGRAVGWYEKSILNWIQGCSEDAPSINKEA